MKILNWLFGKKVPCAKTISESTYPPLRTPQEQLIDAVIHNDFEEVHQLLSSGVSPNFIYSSGCDEEGFEYALSPMDVARHSNQMQRLLRHFGAKTIKEQNELKKQEENLRLQALRRKREKQEENDKIIVDKLIGKQ